MFERSPFGLFPDLGNARGMTWLRRGVVRTILPASSGPCTVYAHPFRSPPPFRSTT